MLHNSITVSAPGKLHLLGEHSVVYGKPAILAAVNKRCTVTLRNGAKETSLRQGYEGQAKGTNDSYIDFCLQEAFDFFKKRKSSWDGGQPAGWTPPRWTWKQQGFLKLQRGEPSEHIISQDSFGVDVDSDIPLGSGMGSSAAIAVAIAGSVVKFVLGELNKQIINEIAFRCEKYVHINPSGGDNSICTNGGFIWYQKKSSFAKASEDKAEKIIKPLPFSLSKTISSRFFIINTGRPEETTGEMVEKVRIMNCSHRDEAGGLIAKKIINEQGELVHKLLAGLQKEDVSSIASIMQQGEKNLELLGVVSDSTKKLIRKIEQASGAAKICGAGGVKKASGIVLVFASDFVKIQKIAKEFNFPCEKIGLGEEGVRVEELRIEN